MPVTRYLYSLPKGCKSYKLFEVFTLGGKKRKEGNEIWSYFKHGLNDSLIVHGLHFIEAVEVDLR